MKGVYYNEIDPFAVVWLKELMKDGLISEGDIDTRSIMEVMPDDVRNYTRVHFFAGIAGWEQALKLAQWPIDRPVWTGSAPCQSFSIAGKQKGTEDERHLWPEFFRLIKECHPFNVFGEQVEGAIRHGWLDLVSADMEGEGYAIGSVVLGAHSLRAHHIRQRLYFVAESDSERGCWWQSGGSQESGGSGQTNLLENSGGFGWGGGSERCDEIGSGKCAESQVEIEGSGPVDLLGDSECSEATRFRKYGGEVLPIEKTKGSGCAGASFWSDCAWLPCRDGKWRATESTIVRLADGVSDRLGFVRHEDREILNPLIKETQNRVGRLKGYGNAIVPQVAAEFIRAYMDTKMDIQ